MQVFDFRYHHIHLASFPLHMALLLRMALLKRNIALKMAQFFVSF